MLLNFGKFRGRDISDAEIPDGYLEWLLRADVNCLSASGKQHVERELRQRRVAQAAGDRWRQQRTQYDNGFRGESWGEASRESRALVGVSVVVPRQRLALMQELVEAGFKVLSMKLHPDKGGTTAQMQELNELRTRLREQLKEA